jgi:glycolate oxidase iron-sulfur subunit
MQHVQRVTQQPRELLARVGFRVLDVPEKHFCCGSAGTYNLLQPEMADALGVRKAGHIASTDPDIVATGNIGCIMQLRRQLKAPVVHTVELLDWASGGPLPLALEGVSLRTPTPPPSTVSNQTSAGSDVGIW